MLDRPAMRGEWVELVREWEQTCLHQGASNESMRLQEDVRRSRAAHKQLPCFLKGDFVCVARTTVFYPEGEKCYGRWFGPFRICDVVDNSNYCYEVEDLTTPEPHRRHQVHIRRMKFFCRGDEATVVDMRELAKLAGARYYEIDYITDFVFAENPYHSTIKVKYTGFELKETTLLRLFVHDAPEFFLEALAKHKGSIPVHFVRWLYNWLVRCPNKVSNRALLTKIFPSTLQAPNTTPTRLPA
eukprot:GHVU01118482.1.p1 GENE.GHVU01118482.1~~GHVU01118482.1.p1  ORF type:complete len:264 (-),score=23.48 GHVU01118482.1:375-1100(-)